MSPRPGSQPKRLCLARRRREHPSPGAQARAVELRLQTDFTPHGDTARSTAAAGLRECGAPGARRLSPGPEDFRWRRSSRSSPPTLVCRTKSRRAQLTRSSGFSRTRSILRPYKLIQPERTPAERHVPRRRRLATRRSQAAPLRSKASRAPRRDRRGDCLLHSGWDLPSPYLRHARLVEVGDRPGCGPLGPLVEMQYERTHLYLAAEPFASGGRLERIREYGTSLSESSLRRRGREDPARSAPRDRAQKWDGRGRPRTFYATPARRSNAHLRSAELEPGARSSPRPDADGAQRIITDHVRPR